MGRLFLSLSLAGAVAAATPFPRSPAPLQFFGEDWDAAGGDFPVSRATRDAFLARLDGVAVEDFEHARGRVLELPLGGYGARVVGGAKDSVSTALRLAPGRRATSR